MAQFGAAVIGELASPFAHRAGNDDGADRRVRRAIARAADGDRDALRELYVRYAGPVYRHVRGILRDEHEAQDVTQLVFLKLIAALPAYDENQGPFQPWLIRVAHNLTIDHIRRSRSVPAEDVEVPEVHNDEASVHRAHALHDALAGLSADQREVLVLRQVVGMRPREIAAHLDRSEGAVHALHHRARAAMRASLLRSGAGPATRGRGRRPAHAPVAGAARSTGPVQA